MVFVMQLKRLRPLVCCEAESFKVGSSMVNLEKKRSGLKTLLLTDIPPCSNWTAGIVTAQMCRAFEPGALAVFAVMNPDISPLQYPDLTDVPAEFFAQPNEDYSLGNMRYGNLTPEQIFAAEATVRAEDIPRLVNAAVKFGRSHGVEQVWAILQGQTMVRMALAVSDALDVSLKTQIWDPFSWWQLARNLDPKTCELDNKLLEKTIRASDLVIAPSWAMAADFKARYGVPSVPIIASIAASVAEPPATGVRLDGALTIGIAGQFYASDAWVAFYDALDSCGWSIGGRDVVLNVYGAGPPPNIFHIDRVRLRGWIPQKELVGVLASECDVCYCPYPFDPQLADVSRYSFPSKLVVYLASGRPVLFHGPDYSSPSMYLEERGAGICCHTTDASSIIAAIAELSNNPSVYSATANRGSTAFMADFTLDKLKILVSEHLSRGKAKKISLSSVLRRAVKKKRSDQSNARRMFNPYFYWNSYRHVREFKSGITAHYRSEGWRERLSPHPLFCVETYLSARPDVAAAGIEPFAHYLSHGWKEGTDPHPLFSIMYYLERRPDVAMAHVEPLCHYLQHGWKDGSDPHPLFSTDYYLKRRPEAKMSGEEPLTHYIVEGWKQRLDPHPLFSVDGYLASRQDVAAGGIEPLAHYLRHGWKEGTDPNPVFSVNDYLASRPDIVAVRAEPLTHYLWHGWKEGTDPHPLFSVSHYLESRPDVAAAGAEPLTHYLRDGWREGADPHPLFSSRQYLLHRPDAVEAGVEPLAHYLATGWKERTDPHWLFSVQYYLAARPDVAVAGVEPFSHYLRSGWREGANPHPLFSVHRYLAQRPDAVASNSEPLMHYFKIGWRESTNPHPLFSVSDYLNSRPDVAEAEIEPLTHYLRWGWGEGTVASKWFSSEYYCEAYPEFAASGLEPLSHYLERGWKSGFDPNSWFSTAFYLENNADVDFEAEAPLTHYVSTGWKEWRDPNPWFSVRDYRERIGVENSNFEPITHFLKHGEPLVRQGPVMTMTAQFVRNYRNTVALRQAARENDRLRVQVAREGQEVSINAERVTMGKQQRTLLLVEEILSAVGARVTNDLEAGGLDEETQFRIWNLLRDIVRSTDTWLRIELAEK